MKPVFRLWSRNRLRREVDEEIRAHLEMRTRALEAQGLSPEEARREAERRFGEVPRARRRLVRGARRRDTLLAGADLFDALRRDLGLALRQALRRPGGTALEIAVFALGVGLATASFTLVDRVLLRPLPLPEPDRLVSLQSVDSAGRAIARVSASNWYDWRDASGSLNASGLHDAGAIPVATDRGSVNVAAQTVVGGFFDAVAMPLVWGRTPDAREMESEPAVVVVSRGLWDRLAGGPPRGGHVLRVSGRPREIVGVVAEAAAYPPGTRLWLPDRPTRGSGAMRNNINWYAVGRLAEDASREGAREELSAVARAIRESDPEALYSHGVNVTPLRDFVVGGSSTVLWLLMGAGFAVLLVASGNLAALNVARTSAAWREVAVRRALGAGRGRVVRQIVIRHLVVALAGGGLGLLLARAGTAAGVRAVALGLPRAPSADLDVRVAAFAIGVSLLAGLLSGLLPALRASTASLGTAGRGAGGPRHGVGRAGSALVGTEVALSALLLAGGGLVAMDLGSLLDRELGFDADPVVVARTRLVESDYREAPGTRAAYWIRVREAVASLPGFERAAVSSSMPTGSRGNGFIEVEGWRGGTAAAAYQTVSEGYFEALSMDVLAGRTFGPEDGPGTGRVVVVNRTMAERYWSSPDPGQARTGRGGRGGVERALGGRVRALSMENIGDPPSPWLTVVGVVEDIRSDGFASDPEPEMYVHFLQAPSYWMGDLHVVARAFGPATAAARDAVAETVRRVDPRLAVEAELLSDEVEGRLADARGLATLLGAFALVATALAGLGVYGLVSFGVSRRTREMGIRAALGARRPAIVGLVMATALRVAVTAATAGLLLAWLLRGALRPVLTGIDPGEPAPYLGAAVFLVAVTAAASFLPAWRAARLDPVRTLREERV